MLERVFRGTSLPETIPWIVERTPIYTEDEESPFLACEPWYILRELHSPEP